VAWASEAATSPIGSAAAESRRSAATRLRAVAAQRAPTALKRAVWRRRMDEARAQLDGAGGAAGALGALTDWAAVLRIAEHRLRSLPPDDGLAAR